MQERDEEGDGERGVSSLPVVEPQKRSLWDPAGATFVVASAAMAALWIGAAWVMLFGGREVMCDGSTSGFCASLNWFAEWLTVFNFWLLMSTTLMISVVSVSYAISMRAEKWNRLGLELRDLRPDERAVTEISLSSMFQWQRYLAASLAPTLVTFLGMISILFIKPVFETGDVATGVNFAKGSSVLLLGLASDNLGDPARYKEPLVWSLTAFNFGFLGGWVYFMADLMRSYFNCDLRPRTLVSGAVRMTVAAVTALVVALAMQAGDLSDLGAVITWLPEKIGGLLGQSPNVPNVPQPSPPVPGNWIVAVAFMIGIFPKSGLAYLKGVVSSILPSRDSKFKPTSLGVLPGMSYQHSERLQMEGIDGTENLAGFNPVLLTLQTGFPYPVIEAWIGESWLRLHLGEVRYTKFAANTGLRGKYELRRLGRQLAAERNVDLDGPDADLEVARGIHSFLSKAMASTDGESAAAEDETWMALSRLCLHFDLRR